MGEFVQYDRLRKVITERERGKKIVLTGGCFDIIHSGHSYLFEVVKGFGDILVVNVASDERIEYYKGIGPFMSQMERVPVVSAMIRDVDYVTIHPSRITNSTIDLAFTLGPDILVQSKSPEEGSREEERLEELQNMGVEFRLIGKSPEEISSREIVKRIKKSAPRNYGSKNRILT